MTLDMIDHVLRAIFGWFGLAGLSFPMLILLASSVVVACIALGWLGDTILQGNSLGIAINGILLLAGFGLSLWLWRLTGLGLRNEFLPVALFLSGLGGGAVLMGGVLMRRYI